MTTDPVRPGASDDVRLALRAATLYHLEGATQADIAAKLGVSRPTAGRLIARARAQGLVRIEISVPDDLRSAVHTDIERDLERLFGLTEAVVIGDVPDGSVTGYQPLGRSAAAVLGRRLQADDTLGFTWGPETVAVAQALRTKTTKCANVVQLDGSMTSIDYQTGVDYTLGRCATQLQATPVRLHAPLYADPATVTALEQDSIMGRALSLGRKAEVMMFGVGPVSTSTTLFEGSYIDTAILDELRTHGAVGEIGGRFYRLDGSIVDGPLPARTVSVPLEAIRDCRASLLVSGGELKHEAIFGALAGGMAKILVTDINCAQWLLEQKEESAT
ncbi:MarR family transcriptional regulator [Antrihabitans sp. YC3-6]|uniref:MarR family transcriptional regulator n=1 Tax=Antrihabitans stalagmiti TaxID=2799499 RepID=A0A934NP60_9NOCA|nr:sugar-binding domain-containing protein [Antrihabitans stalagmiti]MBJ8338861.1 MarR family transcriptional regulator [Antrihabitans stalagmiti]